MSRHLEWLGLEDPVLVSAGTYLGGYEEPVTEEIGLVFGWDGAVFEGSKEGVLTWLEDIRKQVEAFDVTTPPEEDL